MASAQCAAVLRIPTKQAPKPEVRDLDEDEITAIALLGDAVIDLREAKATSKEITIRAYALLNDVDVIVPEGIAVELSGVAVVGDNRNMTRPVPAGTSRFVVKIHGHALLGDVQVFHSNPRHSPLAPPVNRRLSRRRARLQRASGKQSLRS